DRHADWWPPAGAQRLHDLIRDADAGGGLAGLQEGRVEPHRSPSAVEELGEDGRKHGRIDVMALPIEEPDLAVGQRVGERLRGLAHPREVGATGNDQYRRGDRFGPLAWKRSEEHTSELSHV